MMNFRWIALLACIVFGVGQAQAATIASYDFDGGTATDSSSHNHHGTVYGATATTDRHGNPTGAMNFDGNDTIELGPLGQNVGTVSVSVWAYHQTPDTWYHGIVYKGHPTQTKYDWYVGTAWTSISHIRINNETGGGQLYSQDDDYPNRGVGQWHHLVYVIEDLGNDLELKLYVDGTVIKSTIFTNTNLQTQHNTWYVGRAWQWSGSNQYYEGRLDDLAIYDHALSQAEITELYEGEPIPAPLAIVGAAGIFVGTRFFKRNGVS